MRNRGEIVSVVDFGSREIRVLIARKDDDGTISIIGHGTAPGHGCVYQGVIQNLNSAQIALKQAIASAEKEARVKIRSLFCGVSGTKVETFIREGHVKLEREIVEHEHMFEALDIASRDILAPGKRITTSLAAQEWYVDDLRVGDPVDIRGHVLKTRVHFARIPTVIEDNIVSCIESQRRELEDVVFMPLASALGCLTPEDMELGVAVLDLGRSTTGLAIYRDYRILGTHCFEWGGYHLTRDVSAGLQVSFDEADELILEYGISDEFIKSELRNEEEAEQETIDKPEKTARIKLKTAVQGAPSIVDREMLDMIIYERANELMNRVKHHINARGLAQNLVRGIVLTGGAGAVKNQTSLAEAVFQVPCRLGMPNSIETLPHEVNAPEFSAAVGLSRHAFEYRAAARNGRLSSNSVVASGIRKFSRFFRKYFF